MAKSFKFLLYLIILFVCIVIMSIMIENRQLSDIASIKSYCEIKTCHANLVVLEKDLCIENKKYRAVYLRPEFPSSASGCRILIFNDLGDCLDRTVDIGNDNIFKKRWQL